MTDKPLTTTLERLDDQIRWHESRAGRNQRMHRWSSVSQIVLSASIILSSAVATGTIEVFNSTIHPAIISALIAACLTVLKGIESTFDWQTNWVSYRTVAEALKQEKFLHVAGAGPYGNTDSPDRLLAERVEELISKENAQWVSSATRRTESKDNPVRPSLAPQS